MNLIKPSLADYITEKLSQPFEYGVNDCVLFTIGWVEIAAGKKYLPTKLWKTEREAIRMLKLQGGLIEIFGKHFQPISPNYAKDGDITVFNGVAYLFSGACIVSVGKNGLINNSRLLAKQAWTYEVSHV